MKMSGDQQFKGLNPKNSTFRSIDNNVCPKDDAGKYPAGRQAICHGALIAYHAASMVKDKAYGGTGEYDQKRMDAHLQGIATDYSKSGAPGDQGKAGTSK